MASDKVAWERPNLRCLPWVMTTKRRWNTFRILIQWEVLVGLPIGTRALQVLPHTLEKSRLTIRSTVIFHVKWLSVMLLQDLIACIRTFRLTIRIVRLSQVQTETVKSSGPRPLRCDLIRDSKTTRIPLQLLTIIAKKERIIQILVILPLFTEKT